MRRPLLRRTIERFAVEGEGLYLIPAEGNPVILRDAGPGVCGLLRELSGERELDEVATRAGLAPVVAEGMVAQLAAHGLVVDAAGYDALDASIAERFDRQLLYFTDLTESAARAAEFQRRLGAAHVTLLGLGGLGSWTLFGLLCAGVGGIRAVDFDSVELSNLNRQILFCEADLGRPKVEVAAEVARRFAGSVAFEPVRQRLESLDDVRRAIAGTDFVVEVADWPPHSLSRWVNSACLEQGIPHVSAGQAPPRVRIGPTYIPGLTGCLACEESAYRRRYRLYDAMARARMDEPATAATFGPACGLIGSLLASDVVHHLAGVGPPATTGRAITIDLRDFSMRSEATRRLEDCEQCSAQALGSLRRPDALEAGHEEAGRGAGGVPA